MSNIDYVSFECVHIADADVNDADEKHALAYADIDGYPAGEDGQGMVICRVWLMRQKDDHGQLAYIVDWHHNGYRSNQNVMERIEQAKKDLAGYKEQVLEQVFERAYERYKVQWMYEHYYTIPDLLGFLQKMLDNDINTIKEAFDKLESVGFRAKGGKTGFYELWEDKDDFRDRCWQDSECMGELLSKDDYQLWRIR